MDDQTKELKKKWWQYKRIGGKEAAGAALFGLLGFIICFLILGEGFIADIFGLIFWISGIVWLIITIRSMIEERIHRKS